MRSLQSRRHFSALLAAFVAAAVVVSGRAAAETSVDVTAGFAGRVRAGEPLSLRIDAATADAPGEVRLIVRESAGSDRRVLHWEIPLDLPPRTRRTDFVEIVPAWMGSSVLTWSVDGERWMPLPVQLTDQASALAVIVTERAAPPPGLEAAFQTAGSGHGSSSRRRGSGLLQAALMAPEDLPRSGAAWEAVELVVIEAELTHRVHPDAWSALGDGLLMGGVLLVHGSVPPQSLPSDLTAARPASTSSVSWADAEGRMREHAALFLSPVAGAETLRLWGRPEPWAADRSHGYGRAVSVGVDLGSSDADPAYLEELWRVLLGITTPGDLAPLRQGPPAWSGAAQRAALRQVAYSRRALQWLGLGFLGLLGLAAAAILVLGRRPTARDRAWTWVPAACVLAAVPLLVAGAWLRRPAAERVDFVLEEDFPEAGRRRVTRVVVTRRDRRGDLPLPCWPAGIGQTPSRPDGFVRGRFVVGQRPRLEDLDVAFGTLALRCRSWEEARPSLALRRRDGTLEVRNLSDVGIGPLAALDGAGIVTFPTPDGEVLAPGRSVAAASGASTRAHPVQRLLAELDTRGLEGPVVAGAVSTAGAGLRAARIERLVVAHGEPAP